MDNLETKNYIVLKSALQYAWKDTASDIGTVINYFLIYLLKFSPT